MLQLEASPGLAQTRAVQLLQFDVAELASSVAVAEAGAWDVLRACVTRLRDNVERSAYSTHVPAELRVLYHLVESDRRADAEAFLRRGGLDCPDFPTSRDEVGWVQHLPFFDDDQVPRETFLLTGAQMPVRSAIRSVRRLGETTLEVYGWAYIENVDLADRGQTVRAWARCTDAVTAQELASRVRVPLEVFPAFDEDIDEFARSGSTSCDYRTAAFSVRVPLEPLADGNWTLDLEIEAGGETQTIEWTGAWAFGTGVLRHVASAGAARVAVCSAQSGGPLLIRTGAAEVVARGETRRGQVPEVGPGAAPEIVTVDLHDDSLVISVRSQGVDLTRFRAEYQADQVTLSAATMKESGDLWSVVLGLYETRWGESGLRIPPGFYRLRLVDAVTGDEQIPVATPELLDLLPLGWTTDAARVTAQLRALHPRTLAVMIRPPLLPQERGQRNQARLRSTIPSDSPREHSVFFRNLFGETTDDSALAIHEELQARGTDLTLYWSVRDRSVPVPEGGVPLIEGSQEWHRRLGAAAYLVVNVHQPLWYIKPPGQQIVQTFHGYPYKMMGQSWWGRMRLPTGQVHSYLERSAQWDHLVSPAAYATPHLLREFFTPEAAARVNVIEAGYPRNDVLLGPDTDQIRARVRTLLGIADDQKAVLYAPTFRDYLSANDLTAKTVDFLDPEALTRRLGPDYVLLMRGHAFHARANIAAGNTSQIRDVTYYPTIADLCLASDAAILDYSSLRFDYALTRKPIVFLVPDNDIYHTNRPGIIDYAPTAPGPHLTNTRQVADQLRDLDTLTRRYQQPIEDFITSYLELEDGHAASRVVDQIFPTS
jgi:CDP-glycerol glycerophosphotransferase (TagB/SpsB family)